MDPVAEGLPIDLAPTLTPDRMEAGPADRASLVYLWSVTASNGQTVTPGRASAFGFVPADDGSYTVTLTVTDKDGAVVKVAEAKVEVK